MRGLLAFLLLALLAVDLFNYQQIQQLQQKVTALQAHTNQGETIQTTPTALIDKALPLLAQAQAAIQNADFPKARRLLAEASHQIDQAGRTVNEKAAPSVDWIRRQVHSLQDQIHQR